jgi:SAM-dependent methyltransferase
LLGAGRDHRKKVYLQGSPDWKGELTTLDMNPEGGANVIWDLEDRPLPFDDNTFDEMGAFDVLEHIGRQGDWRGFFDEFAEYWRILKPGGTFSIMVPMGEGALGDPGHVRFFHQNYFGFLNQAFYDINREKGTCASDYRWYWKRNFDVAYCERKGEHLSVILIKR